MTKFNGKLRVEGPCCLFRIGDNPDAWMVRIDAKDTDYTFRNGEIWLRTIHGVEKLVLTIGENADVNDIETAVRLHMRCVNPAHSFFETQRGKDAIVAATKSERFRRDPGDEDDFSIFSSPADYFSKREAWNAKCRLPYGMDITEAKAILIENGVDSSTYRDDRHRVAALLVERELLMSNVAANDAEIAHLKNWIEGLCDFNRVMTEKVDEIASLKAEIGSKDAEIADLRSGAAIRRLDKALSAKDAEIAKFKEESATWRDTGAAVVQNLKSDVSAKAAEIDLVVRALNSEDPAGIDALPETLRGAVKEAIRKARTLSFVKASIGIF